MKKLTALFLSLLLVLTMTAALAETDITLWTFPIGDWGNSEKVDEMLAAFNAVHPDIKVTVEYLDYTNGDDEKVAAAKEFIRFICDDETQVRNSVYNTGYFSVRASVTDLYTGTEKAANADYAMFVQYLGDIYQVTTNWTTQRYEWWNLLQRIGDGGNVADEVATYIKNVNL